MLVFLLIDTFELFSKAEKLLWSLAIVSTVLMAILLVASYFNEDLDRKKPKKSGWLLIDSWSILLFLNFFTWTTILAHSWEGNLGKASLYGIPVGLLAALLPSLLPRPKKAPFPRKRRKHSAFPLERAITSTGEVLQYIPSHINGRGKVHLNLREAPYLLNAVCKSGELPVGQPVRVIEVLDESTLVVEPLDGSPPNLPS